MIAITISILFVPLIWELINDRNGDSNKKQDVFIRLLLALTASVVGFYLISKPIPYGLFLSLAIHFFAFDYLIVMILKKRGVIETKESWFEYLGKTSAVDTFKPWVKIGAKGRLSVRLGVLIAAIIVYIS